ncbi:hypothetical protein GALL_50220 [mine drainage metagenome]|uniref:Uncharacterized protein n=1 Tax=mine drainage metagenome TaxID=410659 RepID=A0A1J5TPG3_9ZZZZ
MSDRSTTPETNRHNQKSRLADHILPSSATMIGVCMTVISVSQLIPKHSISKHVDELLAFDSLLFLASAMLSYFSIRHPDGAEKLEQSADIIFLVAIALMVIIGFVVSFELMID